MAYPMMQLPRVRDFIDIAEKEFGAMVGETVRADALPNEVHVLRYLRRTDEQGKKWVSWIPLAANDESRLTPTELRNHCRALDIPLVRFGIDLQMPEDW